MVNKTKWIYNYRGLDPNDQLLIADAIVEELSDNEEFLDASDNYDKAKSSIVREFFESMKDNSKKTEDLNILTDILERYEKLSKDNKDKAVTEISKIILKYAGKEAQADKERACKQEGHLFGKWKHHEWTKYIDTIIDHQIVSDYPEEHENWERKCKRCGYVDRVETEPEELIAERREKAKAKRIKQLKQELKKLTSE